MANSTFGVLGFVTPQFAQRDTAAVMTLGTPQIGALNDTWVYVQASEAVATGTCTVSAAFALTDTAGSYTADTAFASGEYGWVRKTTSPL
tara:strand:+ start:568 stop:837 length:270 start_codon:yes stop_codon:yes gene_type:complete